MQRRVYDTRLQNKRKTNHINNITNCIKCVHNESMRCECLFVVKIAPKMNARHERTTHMWRWCDNNIEDVMRASPAIGWIIANAVNSQYPPELLSVLPNSTVQSADGKVKCKDSISKMSDVNCSHIELEVFIKHEPSWWRSVDGSLETKETMRLSQSPA